MSSRFAAMCYHYIRPDSGDEFPRILGSKESDFMAHLDAFEREYSLIKPREVANYLAGNAKKDAVLLTFDDGLADHYRAAKILVQRGIRGIFFIPSCIIEEQLPANPVILHFAFAEAGVRAVVSTLMAAAYTLNVSIPTFSYQSGMDPWEVISSIKRTVNHELEPDASRQLLLRLYKDLLLAKHPDMMEKMHLTEAQIREMIADGHTIGAHSHSHVSLAGMSGLDKRFEKEILAPRLFLAERFGVEVDSFSFPFGLPRDCMEPKEFARLTPYRFAYTLAERWSSSSTPAHALGRINVMSKNTASTLLEKMHSLPIV